jgi:hypothetical protein
VERALHRAHGAGRAARVEEIRMTPQVMTDTIIAGLRTQPTHDRLLGLYALGLDGCARGDAERVRVVLHELLASLDFAFADVAEAFQELYAYCLAQCDGGGLERVAFVLRDLRATLLHAGAADAHARAVSEAARA